MRRGGVVRRSARGAVFFLFIVVVIGGALTGGGTDELFNFRLESQQRQLKNKIVTNDARDALLSYMLFRESAAFDIATGSTPIEPQILMLPCPDNVGFIKDTGAFKGDAILDGTQDPTCGAKPPSKNNRTNYILRAGSRFGRLPYKKELGERGNTIRDGLGGEFIDSDNNRLWYAVSRNVVPTRGGGAPLNLHRLASLQNEWLSVGILEGTVMLTLQKRLAAVVLSAGRGKGERIAEWRLPTMRVQYKDFNISAYFDTVGKHSNADTDGVFVQSQSSQFDDTLSYISLDSLLAPDSRFMRTYTEIMIGSDVHNAPNPNSPLYDIKEELREWHDFFEFYPIPAANIEEHVHNRFRHCAVHKTTKSVSGLGRGGTALLPQPITVQVQMTTQIINTITTTLTTIATLTTNIPILTAKPWEIYAGMFSVSINNENKILNSMTVATYARLDLQSGATISISQNILSVLLLNASVVLSTNTVSITLSAGMHIDIAKNSNLKIANNTPLYVGGMQRGWLPAHATTSMTIANNGTQLTLMSPLRTGFLGGAVLTATSTTSPQTIVINATDRLMLQPLEPLQIEQNLSRIRLLASAVLLSDDESITLDANEFLPTSDTLVRRRYVALMLADIPKVISERIKDSSGKLTERTRAKTITIKAPKIIYPWRQKTRSRSTSRDNIHHYPPCLDTRLLSRRTRTAIRNQSLYYAVAPQCYAGGDTTLCGTDGMQLSVVEGAKVAAPESFAMTGSYTASIEGTSVTITISDGISTRGLTTAFGGGIMYVGESSRPLLRVPSGYVFNSGQTITLPAGVTIYGGAHIDNIEAMLIYSPSPLLNVRCTSDMKKHTDDIAMASQGGNDLTQWCEWLDDEENADGDLHYIARPPNPTTYPASNDFIMLFGGRVRL